MKISVVLASLILMTLLPAASYSATVTVIAEGVFSQYTDPDGLLPFPEPAPGTVFRIKITYASDTPDLIPQVPESGIYLSAISAATLMIGSNTFGMGASSNNIQILNDAVATAGGYLDLWIASTSTTTPTVVPNESLVEGFNFRLLTISPSIPVPPLTSTDLVQPSWPGGWDMGVIGYSIFRQVSTNGSSQTEPLASAEALITSITVVPVPAAIWLLGSALGLLGRMRRRTA